MKSSLRLSAVIAFFATVALTLRADQSLAGNVTITGGASTGNLAVTGAIDSDSNTLTFGTQGTTFGAALLYQNADADTFTFGINRTPGSWLWQHLTNVSAMRLDSNHQLILYQSNGTTAGVTLTPASSSLKLGTHANGTLTADANGVITAAGGFTVAGNFTNTNGSFTGGSSGLNLSAGGTNQNVALNASGTGDLVFNAGGTERARIKSTGNVGIGTAAPSAKLHIQKDGAVALDYALSQLFLGGTDGNKRLALAYDTTANVGLIQAYIAGGTVQNLALQSAGGNVGIGTTTPVALLHLQSVGGGGLIRLQKT